MCSTRCTSTNYLLGNGQVDADDTILEKTNSVFTKQLCDHASKGRIEKGS